MNKKVLLSGTCNGSQWRETVKPLLKINGDKVFESIAEMTNYLNTLLWISSTMRKMKH